MSHLNEKQIKQFHQDGYLTVTGLFDAEEMDLLMRSPGATSK